MSIIFVELHNDEGRVYQSYEEEFWALVKLSGFKTCLIDEIDYNSDNVYICYLRNGNTHAAFKSRERKCKLILWLQEWGKWSGGIMEQGREADGRALGFSLDPYFDETWVSDRFYKKCLEHVNPNTVVKYVFFGGHPDFGGCRKYPKKWDFVHLSYLWGTRQHKVQILATNGYTFMPEPVNERGEPKGWWGEDKKEVLAYSKWGLALQQQNVPFLNHQRMTLFASWKLPIVCDPVTDPYPYKLFPEGLIHFEPKNTICNDSDIVAEAVEHNYWLVTSHTFQQCVEDAVKGIETRIGI